MWKPCKEQAKIFAFYGGLTALCAITAAHGEPFGFIGVLFFGGCGALMLYFERASGRPPRADKARVYHGSLPGVDRYTSQLAGVVFPAGRDHMVAATLGSAVFVLTGAVFMISGDLILLIVGALSVLVFGVFGLLGLWSALSRHQGIALLPEGVYCRMPTGTAWLPWETIGRTWIRSTHNQPFIAFRANRPEAITLTGPNRWLQRLNRRWFNMDVGYPARALRHRPREVCAMIRRYAADPASRASLANQDETPAG